MMNLLAWNIRGIANNPSLRKLKRLLKSNRVGCFAIIEPKISPSSLRDYNYKLTCVYAISNQEGNIWMMWKSNFKCSVMNISSHYISFKLQVKST